MNVKDKVALITGAADGIGKAVAVALAGAGAEVVLADIDEKCLNEALVGDVRAAYQGDASQGSIYILNVTDGEKIKAMVADIINKHGKIDILVNCAGVISSHPLVSLPESEWERIMNVNLKGMFLVTQSVFTEMIKRKQGKIVNIGSDLSSNGQRFLAHYSASKHGVIGFTRSVALEGAEYGILVNAVCPGPTETKLHYQDVDMQISYSGVSKEDHLKKELENIPLRKLGTPQEVAHTILFLVADENTQITGEAINVSGGLVMH